MKVPQSKEELDQHLSEQLSFLYRSCQSYDAGVDAGAKRIASTLRLLLHDTTNSTSPLTNLGIKEKINYQHVMGVDPSEGEPLIYSLHFLFISFLVA
jgi:hypothetical protein